MEFENDFLKNVQEKLKRILKHEMTDCYYQLH